MTSHRPTPRLPASERCDAIVSAATELFARKGYAATSVDEIVTAAGVTKPILYRHFTSKRALGRTLLERYRDELVMVPLGRFVPASDDRRLVAREMVIAWLDHVVAHPDATRLLFTPIVGDESLAAVQREIQVRGAAMQTALLREMSVDLDEERLVPLGEMVRATLAAAALWAIDHPESELEATREALAELIDRLIAPR